MTTESRHPPSSPGQVAQGVAVLRSLGRDEMTAMLLDAGFAAYRARQLYHWIYCQGASDWARIGNLPRTLMDWLKSNTRIGVPTLERIDGPADGTRKLLFRLEDGCHIESVLMRDEDEQGRWSLCVSSQVGCALGCGFCLTGFGGFRRNLATHEIVSQVIEARRLLPPSEPSIQHVVFMGMGEPLLNLDSVVAAIRLLTDPDGFKLSRRRVTVSTAGIAPGIERLGRENLDVGLAVSLNATTDAVRDRLMPINRKWPIAVLMDALAKYPLQARRRITIEYVLLRGVNDMDEDARRLARLCRPMRCKVNLIMYNPSLQLPFEPVDENRLQVFMGILSRAHLTVTVRRSKGSEIRAACGQLAAHHFESVHA